MRGGLRGYAALLAGALMSLTLPSTVHAGPVATQAEPIVYEDVALSETPNSVAVANDGTIAASLFDDKSIAILPGAGVVSRVPLECAPSAVAIAPDGSTAWAVCQGDGNLYVIDVPSRQVSLADIGLQQAEDVVFIPSAQRLVIADLAGRIVVVSTANDSYEVTERLSTADARPSELAMLPDGSRGYAVTDAGLMLALDLAAGESRVMTGRDARTFLTSIALARSGTVLYAGAALGSQESGFRSAVLALDPVTGATVQELALDFALPGTTTVEVAAGHRSLSVATGMGVDIDGTSTGLFDIALDEQGRLGALSRIMPALVGYSGSDIGRSADGTRIAAGTTNASAVGAIVEDAPYPPTLRVQGRLTGTKLTLTGSTTGMQPGTIVTVYVRDATKAKTKFVAQPRAAVVDARGAYRWTGTVKPAKVQVFTTTPSPAASGKITITRAKK